MKHNKKQFIIKLQYLKKDLILAAAKTSSYSSAAATFGACMRDFTFRKEHGMNRYVNEVLENRSENYILPFFWQHGESEDVLRDYMAAIHGCGIGAVCVEARPHPDFAGPGWWHDMDIIMEEARKRGMKVWLLDDSHFPTGFANGEMKTAEPKLCKQYIAINQIAVAGPMPKARLNVEKMAHDHTNPLLERLIDKVERRHFDDDSLLALIAGRLGDGTVLDETFVDLTKNVVDGHLVWDVPEGAWRLFAIYRTRNGGGDPAYIHMLSKESCHVLIDAVYEPHYEHYKDDFGKTFAGFFSDEPQIGNTIGFNYDESIGKLMMHLPWTKETEYLLSKELGENWKTLLVRLWMDGEDTHKTAYVRYAYMDIVSKLVQESFAGQLGKWCEDHGVEYIGHVLEDTNQHSRLGSGMAHFFRATAGQHMAGIDDIGNQVVAGAPYSGRIHATTKNSSGEFFHFALGKMGSSFGHIDPCKKGRSFCEIFGAYGWGSGVKNMKYLTDHFLVRGINHYVPHAFSPKTFPDPDSSPHYYLQGQDVQFEQFSVLMHYMNRMCHILNGGIHVAPAAMLYHGESEWSGDCMFNQKPARELLEHQIDFDIIPSDVFSQPEDFNTLFDGKLHVNGETYECLIIPSAQFIPKEVAEFAANASKEGFEVIFINQLPQGICGVDIEESKRWIEQLKFCTVVELKQLAKYMMDKKYPDIWLNQQFKDLRYYQYKHKDATIFMFSNESVSRIFDGEMTLVMDDDICERAQVYGYDAMGNAVYPVTYRLEGSKVLVRLRLEPYESSVLVFDLSDSTQSILTESVENNYPVVLPEIDSEISKQLENGWRISLCDALDYPAFKVLEESSELMEIGAIAPEFSGFIRYEKSIFLKESVDGYLEPEYASDGMKLWVNDTYIGMKICPPYRFSVNNVLRAGKNTIRFELATTAEHKADAMSPDGGPWAQVSKIYAPTGILDKIVFRKK